MVKLSHTFVLFVAGFALVLSAGLFTEGLIGLEPNLENAFASIIVPQMTADVALASSSMPHLPPPMTSTNTQGTSTPPIVSNNMHCPTFTAALQRGIKDATTTGQVGDLQQFLSDYYKLKKDDVVSGFFGSTTQSLVKKFQQEHNLPPAGIAGPLTRAIIAQVCLGRDAMHGDHNSAQNTTGDATTGSSTPRMPHGDDVYLGSTTGGVMPHLPPALQGGGQGDTRSTNPSSAVDLKVNGSHGPVSLSDEDSVVVSWTSNNTTLTSCELVGAFTDETGAHIMHNLPASGSETLLAWIPAMGSTLSRAIAISCTGSSASAPSRDYVVVRPVAPSKNNTNDNAGAVYEGVGEIGDGVSKLMGAYLSLFGL